MAKSSKAFNAQSSERRPNNGKGSKHVTVSVNNERLQRAKSLFVLTIERVEAEVTTKVLEYASAEMKAGIKAAAVSLHRASKENNDKSMHRDAHRLFTQLVNGESPTSGFTRIFSDTANGLTTSKVETVHDLFRAYRGAALAIKAKEEEERARLQKEEEEKAAKRSAAAAALAATLTPEQLELMRQAGLM